MSKKKNKPKRTPFPWVEDTWEQPVLKLAREIEEPKVIFKIKFGKEKDSVCVGDILGVDLGGFLMARYRVLKYDSETGEAEVQTMIKNQKRGSEMQIMGNMNEEGAVVGG